LAAENVAGAHEGWTDKLAASKREALTFAAFFAGFDPASVPLFVFCVCDAKPTLAIVAEKYSGFVAGFIQRRNGFAGGLGLFLAKRFPCRLRFHATPRLADCTPCDGFVKREKLKKIGRKATAARRDVANRPPGAG